MTPSPRATWSLRLNLMAWLAVPMVLVLAASLWLSYRTAWRQAMLFMDRDLTSSARMIAEEVRYREGAVGVVIPPAALEIFASDAHDEVAYAVFDDKGVLIAGFPGLTPPARKPTDGRVEGFDTMFRTEAMHAVSLRQPVITPDGISSVSVTVGETLKARDALVRALWLRGFIEQAALMLAAAISIWFGITVELRPILRLRRAVLDRPPQSVEPFDPGEVQQELQPLVTAVNDHMARLGAYLDRQQRFLDGAAHQMRTPLAILKTQIGVGRRSKSDAQVREVLDKIDQSVSSMTRVTNQLLTLGRVEYERARPAAGPVDMRELLRAVVADIAPRALDCGVDLALEAETPCTVAANELLVREMVVNLVDNAIQHAGRGAVATLSAEVADGMGVITVRDNGPGVPRAERERLFSRFRRGRSAGAGGSGLGLTIVAEIAEMSGGKVELPEVPGGNGFAVAVTLPLWQEDQGTASTNLVV